MDIVVPESHLICDMRFFADIEVPPPTCHVGPPTCSTIGIFGLFWVYSLFRIQKIRTYELQIDADFLTLKTLKVQETQMFNFLAGLTGFTGYIFTIKYTKHTKKFFHHEGH
jgi:hypothetical protein